METIKIIPNLQEIQSVKNGIYLKKYHKSKKLSLDKIIV